MTFVTAIAASFSSDNTILILKKINACFYVIFFLLTNILKSYN